MDYVINAPEKKSEVQFLAEQYDRLRTDFSTFYSHCCEVAKYCYPEMNEFFQDYHRSSQGEKRDPIYDNTAVNALTKYAAMMEALNTPSYERWSRLQPSRLDLRGDLEIQQYYDELNEALFSMRYDPRAGFQTQMHSGYMSHGAFGNKIIFVDERPGGGLRYKNIFLGQCVFDVNHQGLVDQVFRVFEFSNQQAYEAIQEGMWKGGTLPDEVMEEISEPNPDWNKRHEYIHASVPNNQFVTGRSDYRGKPYACVYFHKASKHEVYRSGYRVNPYAISRDFVSPLENMGRSRCMRILDDIKSVNEMARDYLTISHKAADPPTLIMDDSFTGSGAFSQVPGALNVGMVDRDGRPLAIPFGTGANPSQMEGAYMMKIEAINSALLVDVFNRVSQKDARMTLGEALLRDQEKAAELSPGSGREQTEGLTPMIQREMDILFKQAQQGLIRLPQPPQRLLDAAREDGSALEVDVVHTSPVMKMQKAAEQMAVDRVTNKALELAQWDEGESLSQLQSREILMITAEAGGAPARIFKPQEQVEAEREEKARQAQMQQMQEMVPAMSQGMLNTAKAQEIAGEL